MAELKTKETRASVDKFIASIKDEQKRAAAEVLVKMMRGATRKQPKMWGKALVGFGSYHYKYASGREGQWPVIGFSPRKTSLTLYIMPGFGSYGKLLEKLGKHKTGKSCLYINKLADVDTKILRQLVKDSVAAMKKMYP